MTTPASPRGEDSVLTPRSVDARSFKIDGTPWPRPGDLMLFTNAGGYDHEQKEAAGLFSEWTLYRVKDIRIGSYDHRIEFKHLPGRWFNGVMFQLIV